MALFPKADLDSLVQLQDMFRIDAKDSFFTSGEVLTEVNIYPDHANNPGTVFNVFVEDEPECWYLDWAYETDGEYTVRVELKTASLDKSIDYTVKAITEEEDNLLASDNDLFGYENELKDKKLEGRNSWKYAHRKAQEEIVQFLYKNGKFNSDGTPITKDQLKTESKLNMWATFEAMLIIFQDLKTSNSAAYNEKLADYSEKRGEAREIYIIKFDADKDGDIDQDDEDEKVITNRPKFFTR